MTITITELAKTLLALQRAIDDGRRFKLEVNYAMRGGGRGSKTLTEDSLSARQGQLTLDDIVPSNALSILSMSLVVTRQFHVRGVLSMGVVVAIDATDPQTAIIKANEFFPSTDNAPAINIDCLNIRGAKFVSTGNADWTFNRIEDIGEIEIEES